MWRTDVCHCLMLLPCHACRGAGAAHVGFPSLPRIGNGYTHDTLLAMDLYHDPVLSSDYFV